MRIREQECTDTALRLDAWGPTAPTSSSTASLEVFKLKAFWVFIRPLHARQVVIHRVQAPGTSRFAVASAHTPDGQEDFGKSGPLCVHQPRSPVALPLEVLVRHDRLSRPTNTAHGCSAYCRILLWPPSTHGTRYPIRDSPPSCVDGTVPGGSIRKSGGFVMIWGTRGHELSPVVYSTSLCTNSRGAGWMHLPGCLSCSIIESMMTVAVTMSLNTATVGCL